MLFSHNEYTNRLQRTKERMEEAGVDVLLLTNPSNINYLSGYDGWTFYVDQMLLVFSDENSLFGLEGLWTRRLLN